MLPLMLADWVVRVCVCVLCVCVSLISYSSVSPLKVHVYMFIERLQHMSSYVPGCKHTHSYVFVYHVNSQLMDLHYCLRVCACVCVCVCVCHERLQRESPLHLKGELIHY